MQTVLTHSFSAKSTALKYFAIGRLHFVHNFTYLVDAFTMGLLVDIRVWILFYLYSVAYRSYGHGTVGGLSLAQTVWIVMLAQSFQISSATRLIVTKIHEEIKSGDIAYTLIRPFSFLMNIISSQWGTTMARMLVTLVVGAAAPLLLVGTVRIGAPAVFAAALLVAVGATLNILMSSVLGLLTFWMEEVAAFRWIYDKLQWYVSGMVVPLALFPDRIRAVAEATPFAQIFYAPARILVGYSSPLFLKYLLLQGMWLIIIFALAQAMYRKGVKHVSINGG